MASPKEIDLVCDIQRAAIQVNMQGKYHAWVDYSGHVQGFEVRVGNASDQSYADLLDGWNCHDRNVYLSTGYELGYGEKMKDVIEYKVELLEKLKAELIGLLDVDADGVPV